MENEIKIKDLVKDGRVACFSHAISGVLYYRIDLEDGTYQFCVDMNDKDDECTVTAGGWILREYYHTAET